MRITRFKNQIIRSFLRISPVVVMAAALTMTSCEDEVFDAPTFELSTSSGMTVAGKEVSTTLTITAPGGASELIILKNGVPSTPAAFNGEKSVDYDFEYTIDEGLAVGSVINFSFQVEDKQGKQSDIKVYAVTVTSKEIVEITGNITTTVSWTNDKVYRLNGFVRVQDGGRLNIEKGTVIIGDRQSKGTLVVQMGGKIYAEGTSDEPIVFTSENPVGLREPGDWGGVVLCGKAPNNVTATTGQPIELEGGYGAFHGGTDPNDNSGILRYVRIEYAGVPINPNEEVNSLTMGSVGKGTVIEYVMCSYGLDDAFEWFGGTVDGKYLIAFRGLDDDFDVDLGFSGRIQFGLGVRYATNADQSGSNGFEVDNNGTGSSAQPFTSAVFSNISIIGPKANREVAISLQFQHAAQLRRNSRISIYNSMMTGYPAGLFIDDDKAGSGQAFLDDNLQIRNVFLAGVEHWGGNGYGSAGTVFTDAPSNGLQHPNMPRDKALKSHANFPGGQAAFETQFNTTSFRNTLYNKWQDLGVDASVFGLLNPKFTPNAGSVLLTSARWDNTPKADTFFQQVNHIGAFGTTDWTAGWAAFNCHLITYF
jgi:hypothetical protein